MIRVRLAPISALSWTSCRKTSLEIRRIVTSPTACTVAVLGASHSSASSPITSPVAAVATFTGPEAVATKMSNSPSTITQAISPVSPWLKRISPASSFWRSLANAKSFNFERSRLAKNGMLAKSATSWPSPLVASSSSAAGCTATCVDAAPFASFIRPAEAAKMTSKLLTLSESSVIQRRPASFIASLTAARTCSWSGFARVAIASLTINSFGFLISPRARPSRCRCS